MKTVSHISVSIILLMMIGCQKNIADSENLTSDEQLILAIQSSNDKRDINVDQLPVLSREVLDQDYSDYITVSALIAYELGYEVLMGGAGDKIGINSNVYFNLEGRRLKIKGDGRDKDGWNRDNDKSECFKLVLPVTFNMPDGSTIIVVDEDGYAALKDWYTDNPDTDAKPELQYPVQITIKGITKTINTTDEMRRVYRMCAGKDKDRDNRDRNCFELVYPVTFIMPDGSTITVDDREDWLDVKTWYTNHPDSDARPELQYPVDIIYRDGTTVTTNTTDEMRAAKADCRRDDGDRDCFELVLPVTFIMPDDSIITVAEEANYMSLRTWYIDHPDSDARPELQYSVDIIYRDGTTVTINTADEMRAAKADCGQGGDGGGRP